VPFANGQLLVFRLDTGAHLVSHPLATKLTPIVDGPRVLVTGDRVIDAILGADGAPQWKAMLPAPAAYAPLVRGGWAFVPLTDGSLTALRADTGKAVWTTPVGPPTAAPVVEGDRVYAAAEGGALHAITVSDGSPIWRVALDGNVTAMAAVEGHVFAATAGRWLYALDARRGSVRWRFRIGGTAIGLAVDDDRVVAVLLDQSVRAFKIGSGAQAWRQPLSFRPAAGPVITGESLLVTGYGPGVRILSRRTGRNQGLYAVPVPGDASAISLETLAAGPVVWHGPTPFDDLLVVVTQRGLLHVARRGFDPKISPLTALPGLPVPVPSPPPGWVAPVEAPKTESAPAAPAAAAPAGTSATAPPVPPPPAPKPPR
jgi:outer membrane protein assembly factor BamB